MDNFRVQSLIAQGRLVKLSDVDPNESYLQIGVFQRGNRKIGPANINGYESYAIPLAEIGAGAVNVTYSELYNLIVNQQLTPGAWYRITDYKSVNYLNGGWIAANGPSSNPTYDFDPLQLHYGDPEVIVVQAISTFELSPTAYSETYPGDILQYEAYTNKIGLYIRLYNGGTLPDFTVLSGFDLKWDGTNVYIEMPADYPALLGHYFYIYFYASSTYEAVYEPLTPVVATPQYDYNSPGIGKILLSQDCKKIILPNISYAEYLNYVPNTLYVEAQRAVGNAYGWVTRRIDTFRNIDVPFDFRGRVYRRYEIDLSAASITYNTDFGTGYYGIGYNPYINTLNDYFLTTGNYIDLKCFGNNGQDVYRIKWDGPGGPDSDGNFYRGNNDNNVIFGLTINSTIGDYAYNNTITDFRDNIIGSSFNYNIINSNFIGNNISKNFSQNVIGSDFQYNTIIESFYGSITSFTCTQNYMKEIFQSKLGDNFSFNILNGYVNQITAVSGFKLNRIDLDTLFNIDFTGATHVYANYNCTIFKNAPGNDRLSYFDGSDVLTVVNPTA